PVDWYEWGEEAFQIAKKENKPLLISIGYASCHWCHVMEKESFMDTTVARIMNNNFVCIKVDREERPDIDNIYSNACQLISGNSGWPLNAFALPDGKPFFAGTYFAKPNWISLLNRIATAYKEQNKKVVLQAEALTNGIADAGLSLLNNDTEETIFNKQTYNNLFDSVYKLIDLKYGGIKGTPKFPMPSIVEFLLEYYQLTGEKKALDAANTTLTQMALGGIYDHVGGGFARYSTDSLWRIPHFEKMLYDNGQLMSVYAHAYQLTRNDFYKNVINEIASFVERDLASDEGGFYSSLNADTEKGEGEFYTWPYDEIKKITGDKSFDLIAHYFNISQQGNWERDRNILFASQTPEKFAIDNNLPPTDFNSILSNAKKL
ncbi:MAG: thioredoxin domain-containing protein, partial [Bacteroidia bacterium]|nr:thioredoxin domain-containing protein [Bacteroidia bacterium]